MIYEQKDTGPMHEDVII